MEIAIIGRYCSYMMKSIIKKGAPERKQKLVILQRTPPTNLPGGSSDPSAETRQEGGINRGLRGGNTYGTGLPETDRANPNLRNGTPALDVLP